MRSIALWKLRLSSPLLGVLVLWGGAAGLTGCSNIEPVTPFSGPITEATQLYMTLTIDHPAVTMSTVGPYNTLQLSAIPRDALGSPMAGLPAATFTSSDTTKVRVTHDGLMTALRTGSDIKVIATMTAGPVRHEDTALVDVTNLATPPKLATLSIHPVAPDTGYWPVVVGTGPGFAGAVLAFDGIMPLLAPRPSLVVLDSLGSDLTGILVDYTSLDPDIATIDRQAGAAHLRHPGQVRLVARTTAYGITMADTATYVVTLPLYREIHIRPGPTGAPSFAPINGPGFGRENIQARITPGGYIMWMNPTTDSVDVTFDGPTTDILSISTSLCDVLDSFLGPGEWCGVGNFVIPPNPDPLDESGFAQISTMRWRRFPVPGIYRYHSNRIGAAGEIVVTNDPD